MSVVVCVDSGVVNRLYDMLRDKDPAVITNCVLTLNEILIEEGGMAINKPIGAVPTLVSLLWLDLQLLCVPCVCGCGCVEQCIIS